jgi:hypothetical protein
MNTHTPGAPPITEDDIANYLIQTPDFFNRHAELLASVQLTSPHGARAVSLQERQAEMLRERIKGLERRIMEMIRHGNENMLLTERLLALARTLLLVRAPADLPERVLEELRERFQVPQVALKVWAVADAHRTEPWAQGASGDVRSLASSLAQPYIGANAGFEAVHWLPEPERAASLVLLPLRDTVETPAFGLLVLASPDPQRFAAGMATDLIERLGEIVSAALARLR